jgi:serine/threonine protein kinase/tetratricopeptide (TPR) repeat protein
MNATSGKAKEIFVAALKLAPDQWSGYLAKACAGDDELRSRVGDLLHANAEAGSFLEPPAAGPVVTVEHLIREGPGTIIGPYKLLEQIGEGGFGLVFMAEQQQPVRRKVALKILKPGMDTRQVIARFEAERQALALMDHPNIARVLDAGETASGRPHFVMELVRGVAITDYCDQNRLNTRERLELFAHVCQAVQHAHHKGIIHRDIKPSNVMVTLHDDVPVVKVIDFGIAKALGQQLTDKTLVTGFLQMVGTPLYMSPEQAQLSGLDIDTRSDIYSLGVLLYELLTGTTPFDKERLQTAGYDEMRRIIREEESPRPSTRVSTMGQAVVTVSERRQSDPKRLSQLLRGELDWIVMKTLEKDRNRRYETANGLAADVQRYLSDEPVAACPPSAMYRMRKFVRRNRGPLILGAVVTTALVLVAGGIGWLAGARALEQMEIAHQAANSLRDARTSLANNRPELANQKLAEAKGQIVNYRAALVALAAEIDAFEAELDRFGMFLDFVDRAHQEETLSTIQIGLEAEGSQAPARPFWDPSDQGVKRYQARAVPFLLEALALYKVGERDDWCELLEHGLLGRDQVEQIRRTAFEELVWLAQDVLDRRRDHQSGLQLTLESAGQCALGYLENAPKTFAPTLAYYQVRARGRQLVGDKAGAEADRVMAHKTMPTIALDHYLQGHAAYSNRNRTEGIKAFEAALRLEPTHRWSMMWLGNCFCDLGQGPEDFAAASVAFTGCIMKEPKFVYAYYCRGNAYFLLGRHKEALEDYSKAIELDPKLAAGWLGRGWTYNILQQWDKAIADCTKGIDLDPKNTSAWGNRGQAYVGLRQWDKAIADCTKTIELGTKKPAAWGNRGLAYVGLRQWDKAIADFTKAIEVDPKLALVRCHRGRAYAVLAQWDKAAADSVKAVELNPDANGAWWWQERAAYHLQAGDRAAYRTTCLQMLERFGRTKDPIIAHRIALSCLLIPQAVADEKLVWELAEQSLAGAPGDPWSLIALGMALYRGGQFEEAVHWGLIVKTWPEDPYGGAGADGGPLLTWLVLAMAHHRLGHTEEARRWLDKAVRRMDKESAAKEIGPLRQQSHVWAMCLVLRREAQELLSKDVTDLPSRTVGGSRHNPYLAYSLGRALERKGLYPEAIAEFRKAIEMKPDIAEAHNCLAWWLANHPNPKDRDPDGGVHWAKKAVELAPKEGSYWNTLGVAHYRAGAWKEAIAALEKSMEFRKGGNSADWFFLAMCHEKLGDKEKARQWYDKAMKWMDKNDPANEELRGFRAESAAVLGIKDEKSGAKDTTDANKKD